MSASREIERRTLTTDVELRAKDGRLKTLIGYGAMFGVRSEDLGGFVEEIAPGAFDESIASNTDVLARAEHDSRMLLGRRSSGTLRVSVDDKGLRYEVDLPDTSVARDLAALVERGDVKQSSFAFFIEDRADEEWKTTNDGVPLRILKRVALVDVAPVAQPAYTQTTVSARALDTAKGVVKPMKPLKSKPMRADFKTAVQRGQIRGLSEERIAAIARLGEEQRGATSSYEEKLEAIWIALYALLGSAWAMESSWCAPAWCIEATFDDQVIVEHVFKLLSYPLTWSSDGVPVFGEPTQVEKKYVPVVSSGEGANSGGGSEARKGEETAPVDLELDQLREELAG